PPEVPSVSVIVAPAAHTTPGPPMGSGIGLTVTVAVLMQPVPSVYVIIATPTFTPPTTPVPDPTVAMNVLPLLQVPPGVTSARVVVNPIHTFMVPVMVAGSGLTVTVAVLIHPVLVKVYVIIDVPADTPETIP